MPPDTKPELAADRIQELEINAQYDRRSGRPGGKFERLGDTTLAIIDSRAQALELLRELAEAIYDQSDNTDYCVMCEAGWEETQDHVDGCIVTKLGAFLERNK